MDKIRDVGMTELVRCYWEIEAIYNFSVVGSLLTEDWCDCMYFLLTFTISGIGAFLHGAGFDVFPDPLKLCTRKRFAITVGNNIFLLGTGFGL